MQISINKPKLTAIFAIVLLITSIVSVVIPVMGQGENESHGGVPTATAWPSIPPAGVTPDVTVTVTPYLSFRPNPIGVGQSLLVNIWTTPPPAANRYLSNLKVTLTKPDGTKVVIGPMNTYVADGTAWFEYVVDQVGTWKIKFDFAGTYFPEGTYVNGALEGTEEPTGYQARPTFYTTTYFKPASTSEQTLEVIEDQVLSWPPSPLPDNYWTRPISPENREWWEIAGNYPWAYMNPYRDYLGPFVTAPNTAHIAWKQPQLIAGLVGGEVGTYSLQTRNIDDPGVIYAGRIYMSLNKPGVGRVAGCYDLRTGEVIYEIPESEGGVTPYAISYVEGVGSVPGAIPSLTPELIMLQRSGLGGETTTTDRLIKIDPWTGLVSTNVTGLPGSFHNNQYVLSVQNLGGGNRRLINWTTAGNTNNFESRIISNISFPVSSIGNLVDFDRSIGVQVNRFSEGGVYGGNIYAVDLKTGIILWNITTDPETPYSSRCASIDEGKVAVAYEDRYFKCWNIYTGELEWNSELVDYPWGDFWSYDASSYNGMLFAGAYTGLYAFDWDDGSIIWEFSAPSVAFETPYSGENAFHSATIVADGKLYTYSCEHTPSQPLTRGWKFYCLDTNTGDELWSYAGTGIDSRRFHGAAADGYVTVSNAYDGAMYVFGKGKSKTTVTAPDVSVPKGTAITLKGTVLDLSPGQPETPCVSKGSMTLQMEYLHMQRPIDGLWGNETITGVPVMLTAIGSDGSYIDIGTVTTNGYYGTFSHAWTPTEEGTYEIIASFAGDDSYGSSAAATAVTVGPPPTPAGPIEPEPTQLITTEVAIIAVAVIAVLAVVGYLVIRKRK